MPKKRRYSRYRAKQQRSYYPFYHDGNPIIDTTPPLSTRARRSRPGRRLLIYKLIVELAKEQNDRCFWCGVETWHAGRDTDMPLHERTRDNHATFDHKVLLSKGGTDTKQNGVMACHYCNHHRGDMSFEDYSNWPPEGYVP